MPFAIAAALHRRLHLLLCDKWREKISEIGRGGAACLFRHDPPDVQPLAWLKTWPLGVG